MKLNKVYYVYIYLNPFTEYHKNGYSYNINNRIITFDHQPFYVGEGSSDRYRVHLNSHSLKIHSDKNVLLNKMLNTFSKEHILENYVVIIESFETKEEALLLESSIISVLGRTNEGGLLTNIRNVGYNTLINNSRYNEICYNNVFYDPHNDEEFTVLPNKNIYEEFIKRGLDRKNFDVWMSHILKGEKNKCIHMNGFCFIDDKDHVHKEFDMYIKGNLVKIKRSYNYRIIEEEFGLIRGTLTTATKEGKYLSQGVCMWKDRNKYFNTDGTLKGETFELCIDGKYVSVDKNDNYTLIETTLGIKNGSITKLINKRKNGKKCIGKYACFWEDRGVYYNDIIENGSIILVPKTYKFVLDGSIIEISAIENFSNWEKENGLAKDTIINLLSGHTKLTVCRRMYLPQYHEEYTKEVLYYHLPSKTMFKSDFITKVKLVNIFREYDSRFCSKNMDALNSHKGNSAFGFYKVGSNSFIAKFGTLNNLETLKIIDVRTI